MTSLDVMWQHLWLSSLAAHLATQVSPLLPEDREVLATGHQISIVIRRPGEALVLASSMNLPNPDEESAVNTWTAARLFGDLQDEIALHLGRAWPVGESGAALTARATDLPDGVALSFVSRTSDEELRLEPFRPPRPLSEAKTAG